MMFSESFIRRGVPSIIPESAFLRRFCRFGLSESNHQFYLDFTCDSITNMPAVRTQIHDRRKYHGNPRLKVDGVASILRLERDSRRSLSGLLLHSKPVERSFWLTVRDFSNLFIIVISFHSGFADLSIQEAIIPKIFSRESWETVHCSKRMFADQNTFNF
jgi:hypothetical protein